MTLTRRELLQTAVLAGAGAMTYRSAHAAAPSALGVQLYTVRDQIGTDPEGTLKAIADIGYREVEVLRGTLERVAPAARRLGLSPISIHVETPLVTGKWDAWSFLRGAVPEGYGLAEAIRDSRAHGAKYFVLPYLMPTERENTAAFYTGLAETMNRAGRQAADAGLQFCYHNHGFEFEPLPDGRLPLDVLMEATDPSLVKLELDVFWVGITGNDPVALIRKYGDRIALMHLKDKRAGAPTATQEMKVPPTAFTAVGSGSLDFSAILEAGAAAGVAHYFVEQDHSPGSPIDSLRESYQYLRSL
jgi:sugar phosphate isomerase/epimerase